MTSKKTTWKIAVDKDGNHYHYDDPWRLRNGDISMVEPFEFEDRLYYLDYEKGRSRVTIRFKSLSNDRTYDTTLGEYLTNILPNGEIENGVFSIKGRFGFKKQGTSTAIVLLDGVYK
jgi:hypothetical protein